MFFAIDPANGVAVYEQIVRQVKFAVAREAVKPGEMIPSVASWPGSWLLIPTPWLARIGNCRSTACCRWSAAQGSKWPRRCGIAAGGKPSI